MKYRTVGVLSLTLAAIASFTLYNTASTRAQPQQGPANRTSHNHDHDGHDHPHQETTEPSTSNSGPITAPPGGPPPLPATASAPATSQSGGLQQGLTSPRAADLPPTLLPSSSTPSNTFEPGHYDCPIAKYNGGGGRISICQLEFAHQTSMVEHCDRHYELRHAVHSAIYRSTPYVFGTSRDCELDGYHTSFGAASPYRERCCHDFDQHTSTYHGH